MRRFYDEVLNEGRTDVLDELMTDDFVEHETLPGFEDRPGKEAVKAWVEMVREGFPDLRVEPEDVMTEGDRGAARLRITGTHRGRFLDVPPSGRKVDLITIDMVRFERGKAAEHWGVTDNLKMMQQLGVLPETLTQPAR